MYRLNANGFVIRLSDGAYIPDDAGNRDWQEYQEWLQAGHEPEAPPSPVIEDQAAQLEAAVQVHLDAQAGRWGYDSIFTAVTYGEEPSVPRFQAEGRALRAWRSQVWARCHELVAEVQAGRRPVPTVSELLALLPGAPTRPA
ncbi:hypothetical protein [Eleftheria terrae]|uniref:hypothetical protein n=1 Tax=Eleftheria terrae TaxID=1597781 RepID=UPI00263B9FE4|nr:hypothetical protein [Eleftheria terrae]WKB52323.1 hypothetical protein N7L95_21405 [Eleftheria terrae]